MFVHNFNPIFFSLGPIEIRWYGLVYALGFLFAYWYLNRVARNNQLSLSQAAVDTYVFRLILLSIIGARLIYVFVYNPQYYFANPFDILALWNGGLSFHGGLLGAIIATLWTQKTHSVGFYKIADLLVIPFAVVLFFGRVANFINAELVGHITTVSWCVDFGDGSCRHPAQLYEGIKNLVVAAILVTIKSFETTKQYLREGTIFWLFVLLYGLGRFLTDFTRVADPTDPLFLGILLGQWLSLIMVTVAVMFLVYIHQKPEEQIIKKKNNKSKKNKK